MAVNNSLTKPGTVLVTKTLLYSSSHLLASTRKTHPSSVPNMGNEQSIEIESFFNLCSLIEASVLHDHLVTLKGNYPSNVSEDDVPSITEVLKKEGILEENVIEFDLKNVRQFITNVMEQKGIEGWDFWSIIRRILPELKPEKDIDIELLEYAAIKHHSKFDFVLATGTSGDYIKQFLNSKFEKKGENSRSWRRNYEKGTADYKKPSLLGEQIIKKDNNPEFLTIKHEETANLELVKLGYFMRTYFYFTASKENRLSFFPDMSRINFTDSFITGYNNSIVMNSYKLFAKRLQCEATDFLQDARPIGLLIPPFSSVLFSRCKSVKDIPTELMKLREDFSNLRESLKKLEENRISCTNIEERNAFRKRTELIFEASAKKFENHKKSILKGVLTFGEDIAKPLSDPTSIAAYSSNLLLKPVNWLQEWWYQRPLVQFFDLTQEFRQIPEYNKISEKLFNLKLTEEKVNDFRKKQIDFLNNQAIFSTLTDLMEKW